MPPFMGGTRQSHNPAASGDVVEGSLSRAQRDFVALGIATAALILFVGIVKIVTAGLADPRDDTGKWAAVEIEPVRKFDRPVTLAAIKGEQSLQDCELLRQSRLSVAEISPAEWEKICSMGRG